MPEQHRVAFLKMQPITSKSKLVAFTLCYSDGIQVILDESCNTKREV
jgi:hypothetical protein